MASDISDVSEAMAFQQGIFIADEDGNIYYAERKDRGTETILFTKLSAAADKFQFQSQDEVHVKKIFVQKEGEHDRSVAIIKMMLTLGVATAALPSKIIKNEPGITNLCTSYIINLGSFAKDQQPFWPDEKMNARIVLDPAPETGTEIRDKEE